MLTKITSGNDQHINKEINKQPAIACLELKIETLEKQGVKYVQS